jgi:hypothetical protein
VNINDVDEPGVFALEIDNRSTNRRNVVKAIASFPGAKVKRQPKILSWFREEVFCEFEIEDDAFYVFEPFGDSNFYWIRQDNNEKRSPHLARIREYLSGTGT